MKILFIGGTGTISTACTHLAVQQGFEVHVVNRGIARQELPAEVVRHQADVRKPEKLNAALGSLDFDVVVQWIAFEREHVKADLEFFKDRTAQYIFISSASVYEKPPRTFPITETTPLANPFWRYSQDKIACENALMEAYQKHGFPVTIVRPSHTYDRWFIPLPGRYTVVDRMKKGKKVIVQGDGTSLWTLTHSRDFAMGFNGLFGLSEAIGEAFHITSDEWLSWNRIFEIVARTINLEPQLVHIPSDFIAAVDSDYGAGMLGDKAHSAIFDNSKIKSLVPDYRAVIPFEQGIVETMAWHENPSHQVVNQQLSATMDRVLKAYLRR